MLLTLVACSLVGGVFATAAAAGPLRSVTASPAAFTPNWDGNSDSTRVRVRVNRVGRYRVVVKVRGGKRVAVLGTRRLAAGVHDFWWSGRNASGNVVSPGRYVVRVVPVNATARAARAAARQTTVRIKLPPVAISRVTVKRAIVARSTAAGVPELRFRLNRRASSSAVVRTGNGRVVANLLTGKIGSGRMRARWNGRADNGRHVPDGTYRIAVAATTGGRPTGTVEVPVLVDRTAPAITGVPRTVRGRTSRRGAQARVPIVLAEPATVRFELRGKGQRRAFVRRLKAGRTVVGLGRAQLGNRQLPAGTYRLGMVSRDDAGNRSKRALRVVLRKVAPSKLGSTPKDVGRIPAPNGAWVVPARGSTSSEFGPRWGRMHQGIDIAAPRGRAVVASRGGIVSWAGSMSGYGRTILVEHPGGLTTLYAHLSAYDVVVGQEVRRGQRIGAVGSSGNVTGPHLHFEIRVDGKPVNPRRYVRF